MSIDPGSAPAWPGFSGPATSVDVLPVPTLVLDASLQVVWLNPAAGRLLECEPDEVLGTPLDRWLAVPSRVVFQSLALPLLKLHGDVSELALSLRSATGRAVDALLYASRQPGGGSVLQLAPIQVRRRIESEVMRVKRAADEAPGLLFQLERHPDGRWSLPYASEGIRVLYGLTAEAVSRSAEPWWACMDPDDRAALQAALIESATAGTAVRMRLRLREPGVSGPVWHELIGHARPRADASCQWHGYVHDVSETVRLQEAAVQARAAERLARLRSEFIGRVSHELRTPLNGILGFCELLSDDPAEPPTARQAERLSLLRGAGRHLLGVVNQLLELSGLESGQLALHAEPVAVEALVAELAPLVEAQAVPLKVQCAWPAPVADRPRVLADAQRLRQVLLNLLSNAVKYNRPGGRVELAVFAQGQRVRLSVADTGPGLDAAQQAGLFQPFNRLGAERTGVEGTGLGLVVTRHLVEWMGGHLTVESRPDVGSTFTVELPAAVARQAAASESGPAVSPASGARSAMRRRPEVTGRLLYVEDNAVNAMLLRSALALRPGVQLDVVEDAAQALALLDKDGTRPPDMLLLDMNLPDATGTELLQRVRERAHCRLIPAIAVSADAAPASVRAAREAGFGGYWTKPLDLARMLAELDRWLTEGRLGGGADTAS